MATADQTVHDTFLKLHLEHQFRYIIYEIKDSKVIVVAKTGDRHAAFEELATELPKDDCRFAVADFTYTSNCGRPADKTVLIFWTPDSAPIASKMIYKASNDAIKAAHTGVGIYITASNTSALEHESILKQVE